MSDPISLRLLRFLPRNLLSRAFGWIAARERPRWLVRPFMRWFTRRFGLDLSEAEHPFEAYPSLIALFTRRLKAGARPVDGSPEHLVSPVDAKVGAFGAIEGHRLFQAKGMEYTLAALLGSDEAAKPFRDGAYATLYLSPRDYHRIHAPVDGRVTETLYEPGTLWPVNPPAVQSIPQLFAVNERVTTLLEGSQGPVAVVMVGATNVGSIEVAYDTFRSNQGAERRTWTTHPTPTLARGDELGTFRLGSTVVLLVGDPSFQWTELKEGRWLPMGSAIGRFPEANRAGTRHEHSKTGESR